MSTSKTSQLRTAGHCPPRVRAVRFFDYSFRVGPFLGVLADRSAGPESLNRTTPQRFFMMLTP